MPQKLKGFIILSYVSVLTALLAVLLNLLS